MWTLGCAENGIGMIIYDNALDTLTAEQLVGFFVGWPKPPSPETLLKILRQSYACELARDSVTGNVIGLVNAVSDGLQAAYIPNLEVLPAYQGQGIGTELVRRLLARLQHLYMIDLVCDADLQPFYARLDFRPYSAMIVRNYGRQSAAD